MSGTWFGYSVAIQGDRAIVGAPELGPGTAQIGSATVFVRNGSTWSVEATLTPNDGVPGDAFGSSVAIDGDTAVVGSAWGNTGAYVYSRSGSTWTFATKLAPDTGLDFAANFGAAVDIDGDRIAVGAPGLDYRSYDSGAVYLFEGSGATWTQVAFLIASDGTVVTQVGRDLDLEGDILAVGSHNQGAYVFERDVHGVWAETIKLVAPSAPSSFGNSVALSQARIAVGSDEWFTPARCASSARVSGTGPRPQRSRSQRPAVDSAVRSPCPASCSSPAAPAMATPATGPAPRTSATSAPCRSKTWAAVWPAPLAYPV